ncbi:nitrite reductase (NAD(P)H) small subunit [Paenibacillus nanensis]|uniref:Nitrite reductase (NAD(P)H) small subunit n=1 Tax=Paenibacillus nanensis TaxID=393251 RepID=A0A3A1VRK6_9BACL|nr:nitrite reductase small subunit NirD [Paenibacillus nanensis]RIX60140.1 nitrite reductase (NAD(P)H) small subunit [Paenibacillus nanensis]
MQATDMEGYQQIGRTADFPRRLGKTVRIGTIELAVFQTTEGEIFALENRTPHPKGGTLAEAIVSGRSIYCPMRDLKIDLASGRVQEPDTGRAQVYPVTVEGGQVYVKVKT